MQPKLVPPSSHSLCSIQLFVQRITAFPLTGTKFLALWHSSKMRQPSNCGPPHQSISCCSRVLRVLLNFPGNKHTQSKQQQNVNKESKQLYQQKTDCWTSLKKLQAHTIKTTTKSKQRKKPNNYCNLNKACACALFINTDQASWVRAVWSASSNVRCVAYSARLRGRNHQAKSKAGQSDKQSSGAGKFEAVVLSSPSLISLMVFVDVKQHWTWTRTNRRGRQELRKKPSTRNSIFSVHSLLPCTGLWEWTKSEPSVGSLWTEV